ncbi:hypothetical protein AC578_1286 [Pseudocercospora eumusae]|uniref:Uncharacterized protein n=1 Tax=Pseudocercospora eumusae TaxID=321146 RepID=A0A139HUL3_9PEZI|nr:hypothetical protein AC578_1286 [Pseudocercospora eumusae]
MGSLSKSPSVDGLPAAEQTSNQACESLSVAVGLVSPWNSYIRDLLLIPTLLSTTLLGMGTKAGNGHFVFLFFSLMPIFFVFLILIWSLVSLAGCLTRHLSLIAAPWDAWTSAAQPQNNASPDPKQPSPRPSSPISNSRSFVRDAQPLVSKSWEDEDGAQLHGSELFRADQAHKNIKQEVIYVEQDAKREAVYDLLSA